MEHNPHTVLKKYFGLSQFRPGQQEAIESALSGCDTLVMLPTGSGKSLCYQIIPYLRKGLTIVISPLLSLMQDQVEALKRSGHRQVTALNSFMTLAEKKAVLHQLNTFRLLYLSPEMLQQPYVMQRLKSTKINLLVVDEAHCMSHWGMDFRPDYLHIGQFREQLNHPPVMALTATATLQVRDEIKKLLGFNPDTSHDIIATVDRPEITLVTQSVGENKVKQLLELVDYIQKPGIIYFSSRKTADQMAKLIEEKLAIPTESYHAKRSTSDKVKIQHQFIQNRLQVICATSAFGMGINKQDIRFVIHYHMPASPEMYLQEIGRASRDGHPGVAILLHESGDADLQRYLKQQNLPEDDVIRCVYTQHMKTPTNDPQTQLIHFFKDQGYTAEETIAHFNVRREQVMSHIDYMWQYVQTSQCKREWLLSYFDSEYKSNDRCCDQCDATPLLQFKQTKDITVYEGHQIIESEKILKRLFNLSEKEYQCMLQ